jgi:imidazolonepropionase-like amidohydrolase
MTMSRRRSHIAFTIVGLAALSLVTSADAPHVYAIRGARIVTASGPALANGTVVVRNGLIEAVGVSVAVPPDAIVIEGKGLSVYPGLIDMGNSAGVEPPVVARPQNPRTREEVERYKRQVILRPQVEAADCLKPDAPEMKKLAAAGITTVLATPPGDVISGRSALVNVVGPPDEPQIGNLAGDRRGVLVVRSPVALHVGFSARSAGPGYPDSLMGVIAFVRQSFVDAQHYGQQQAHYQRVSRGVARPVHDAALEALQPVLGGKIPVVFQAGASQEIRRAIALAREFGVSPIIAGGQEADTVTADLKSAASPVLYSLNYPTRPKTIAPDADEPVRVLRARANAPKVPAALHKEGIRFAFQSAGLRDPKEFLGNAAKAVKAGLPADVAVRALTLDAATIAGAGDRLGSIDQGKIANLIVTDGDLFAEKTRIRHVFVDGRMMPPEPEREEKEKK